MKRFFLIGLPAFLLFSVLIFTGCQQPSDPTPDPVIQQSATPTVDNGYGAKNKETPVQASVSFTLSSSVDGTWKVYSEETGTAVPAGVSVSYVAATKILTLSHATDIPHGDYWVSVTETGKTESARLRLIIVEFNKSLPPMADITVFTKTTVTQTSATFVMTSTHDGTWKAYDAAEGGVVLANIHVEFLTFLEMLRMETEDGTPLPAGDYWVTVTETHKSESDRLKLTVQEKTATPTAEVVSVDKILISQTSIDFILTGDVDGEWLVYSEYTAKEPAEGVTASYVAATKILTLSYKVEGVPVSFPAGEYWVTVTETGKGESDALKLTVVLALPPITSLTLNISSDLRVGQPNAAVGGTVGTLQAAGGSQPFVYTLAAGSGSDNNNLFAIDGSDLKVTGSALTFGVKLIRVRVTDVNDLSIEHTYQINVAHPVVDDSNLKVHFTFDNRAGNFVASRTGNITGTLANNAALEIVNTIPILRNYSATAVAAAQTPHFNMSAAAATVINQAAEYTVSTYFWADDVGTGDGWAAWAFTNSDNYGDTNPAAAQRSMLSVWFTGYNFALSAADTELARRWPTMHGLGQANGRGKWFHILLTHKDDEAVFFVDGVERYRSTNTENQMPGQGSAGNVLSTRMTQLNRAWIGRDIYQGNSSIRNARYADFRVYDKALTGADVTGMQTEITDTLTLLNAAPTDITLATVPVLNPADTTVTVGTRVGTFGVLGGQPPYTYALVAGAGDTNNNLFTIQDNELRAGSGLTAGLKSIRVRVYSGEVSANVSYDKVFIVNIAEIADPANPMKLRFTFEGGIGNEVPARVGNMVGILRNGATAAVENTIPILRINTSGTPSAADTQHFDMGESNNMTTGAQAIINTATEYTVSTYFWAGPGVSSGDGWHIWAFGNSDNYGDNDPAAANRSLASVNMSSYNFGGNFASTAVTRTWPGFGHTFAQERWYHILLTHSGTRMEVFVDGIRTYSGDGGNANLRANEITRLTRARIGRNIWQGSNNIRNAKYADFRIYNQALAGSNASGTWRLADDNLFGEVIETLSTLKGTVHDSPAITNFTFTPATGMQINVPESVAPGAVAGTMGTVTGGVGPYTFELTEGEGDDDNGKFVIDGTSLKVGATALPEGDLKIRIKVIDRFNKEFSRAVSVGVIGDAPINALPPTITVQPADRTTNITVAANLTVTATAPTQIGFTGVLSYQWFKSANATDHTGEEVTEGTGGTTATYNPPVNAHGEFFYFVTVTNTNDNVTGVQTASVKSNIVKFTVTNYPTGLNLNGVPADLLEGNANVAPGATIGTLAGIGGAGALSYTLVAGAGSEDNALFTIDGNALKVGAAALVFGGRNGVKNIRVAVTDTQGAASAFERAFTIQVWKIHPNLRVQFDFDTEQSGANIPANIGGYNGVIGRRDGNAWTYVADAGRAAIVDVNGIKTLRLANDGDPMFNIGGGAQQRPGANAGAQRFINQATNATGYTISGYFHVNTNRNHADNMALFNIGRRIGEWGNGDQGIALRIHNPGDPYTLSMHIHNDNASNTSRRTWQNPGGSYARNQWHHFMIVHGGTNQGYAASQVQFFVNGNRIWSGNNLSGDATPAVQAGAFTALEGAALGVGQWSAGSQHMINTSYADFRVYNKALTGAEIAEMNIVEKLNILRGTELSANPVVPEPDVAKTAAVQSRVNFTLASPISGTWRVYNDIGAIVNGVTAEVTGTTLTLVHETNVPTGDYWVTVQEAGKGESNKVRLGVRATGAFIRINFVGLNPTATGFINYAPVITGNGLITRSQTLEVAITNAGDFDKIEYMLNNGAKVVLPEDGNLISIPGTAARLGLNRLTVIVYKGIFPYSAEFTFMVTN